MKRLHSLFSLLILLSFSCSKEGNSIFGGKEPEPKKVYIFAVTTTPTSQEQVTIKNNSGETQDLSRWTIGDKNDPWAYSIPRNTILEQDSLKTFKSSTLGFGINDNNEIIYLKDSIGMTVDTWEN